MKLLYKKFILCLFIALIAASACGKEKSKITVRVEGISDSVLYLCQYYGAGIYIIDTAVREKSAYCFSSGTLRPEGMYLITDKSLRHLIEFFIGDESQKISFSSTKDNLVENLQTNSSLNADFFDYIRFLAVKQREVTPFIQMRDKLQQSDSAAMALLQKEIGDIDWAVDDYIDALIAKHENDILGLFIKAGKPLKVVNKNDVNVYKERQKEFWNNFEFTDKRLLRTPILDERIEFYLNRLVVPYPDSLCAAADVIMNKIKDTPETLKHVLWKLTERFGDSDIMGYDAVFVHIVDNYYSSGFNTWTDSIIVNNLRDRAEVMRPLLIGKTAPDLRLCDTDMNYMPLFSIHAQYIVVYFWDDDCEICKRATPRLVDLYDRSRDAYDLEVYAVYTGNSGRGMEQYINDNKISWINVDGRINPFGDEYSRLYNVQYTPTIYLLDREKRIIAKQIPVEMLEKFITND